jgi:DNA (cytosine-5)-methyltransferase 1
MEIQSAKLVTSLKAVDFFCGAGGVTCGFLKAGIRVLGGIDIDETCKETYEKNNNNAKFLHRDISKYDPEQLQEDLRINRNDDNLVFIGCSPCQYYTIINTSREKSAKSKLLLEDFQRFVDFFKPGFIFIENVPGLGTKNGSPLHTFKAYLTQAGYSFDDRVINAAAFNVAQSRRRYVLMASRVSAISVPVGKQDQKLHVRSVIGAKEVFKPIPAGFKDESGFQHTCAGLSAINIARLRSTPVDGGTRLSWKDNSELQLKCYQGKDTLFCDVYGRMYWDQPAPTITTKFYSISNGRFGHPEQNRAISLKEGAALQSFPNEYKFYANTIEKIARMIGNAVPPNMAMELGKTLIKCNSDATI